MKTAPFNLKMALTGATVVDGHGNEVKHLTMVKGADEAQRCLVGVRHNGSTCLYKADGQVYQSISSPFDLRMKVETVRIGDLEVPAPLREAMDDQEVWALWADGDITKEKGPPAHILINRHLFASREDAEAFRDALRAL